MSLHILSGDLRGRTLRAPTGVQTRPTTSILRKAVFDILQDAIRGIRFLDLFAGSGAMGFEALSRGAEHVTFVENHRDAIRCIQANIASLNLGPQTTLYTTDVFDTLKRLQKKHSPFPIIYADPPYHQKSTYKRLLTELDNTSLLAPDGILFLESHSPAPFSTENLTHLIPIDSRRFGSSLLHRFRYQV